MDADVQSPSSRVAKSKPIGEAGIPPIDFPKFAMPKFEIPAEFSEFAQQGATQAKETCEKMKNVTEQMTDRLKDACATATKGSGDYGAQLIEISRTNANAAFDYAIKLTAAKSWSEVVELSTSYLRRQFDALAEQSKELTAIAQKVANETAEPFRKA